MKQDWQFTTFDVHRGPRCVEVPYVLNNLINGSVLEIGANDSMLKWDIVRRNVKYTLVDPRGAYFMGCNGLEKVTCIKADIRKLSPEQIGKYNNIVVMSTLEHIGLSAFEQNQEEGEIEKIQLEAFKHCTSFLHKKGRLICTVPYGIVPSWQRKKGNSDPGFLLRYTRDRLNMLYEGYNLIDESFFINTKPIRLLRWEKVPEKNTNGHLAVACFIISL